MYRIKHFILSFLFVFSICALFQGTIGCGSCIGRINSWEKLVPDVIDAVVAIEIVDGFTDAQFGEYEPLAGGSGFVVHPDGYIVTNAHVTMIADVLPILDPQIWVRFADSARFIAQEVYEEPNADVAIIKIKAHDLPYLNFETRHAPRMGEAVMSISNPYPFEFNLSSGVVSQIEYDWLSNGTRVPIFIRHTCDISPGSSGSALINRHGRVAGINAALSPHHNAMYFAVHEVIVRAAIYKHTGLVL